MIRNSRYQKLVLVRSFETPCAVRGRMLVAILALSHHCERGAIMNAIRMSQRVLCAVVAILCLTLNANAQEYFLDNFEDGDVEDGMPVTWIPGTPEFAEVGVVLVWGLHRVPRLCYRLAERENHVQICH